ncbi:phage head closure protein [Ciceribacter sp. L1K22]|uniref:phage head closure protein n=1 Tax=Ciceribacter sp. L1K22 TaxID=2820275 RepID=UPI001ABEAF7B|nr:phage head closure protein [Ciceribacter sp. L1K22]MBO3759484.1 phage head closure protein [Ciceribacter sp. L1K22]
MGLIDFDPGQLSARLALERPVAAPDGQGGAAVTFEFVAHAWARIEPVTVVTEEQAGAETVRLTHRIWLRPREGLASGWRLAKGIRHFRVKTLHDPDETGRWLVCGCEEEGR